MKRYGPFGAYEQVKNNWASSRSVWILEMATCIPETILK